MRIELRGRVQNARGDFAAGTIVDWPPRTAQPLLDAGAARHPVEPEPEPEREPEAAPAVHPKREPEAAPAVHPKRRVRKAVK